LPDSPGISRFERVAPEVLFRVEPGLPSNLVGVRLPGGPLVGVRSEFSLMAAKA